MRYDIGTPSWSEARKMWRLAVQRDGVRKWFTSKTPGRNGKRVVIEHAEQWLESLEREEDETPIVTEAFARWLEETRTTVGMPSYRTQESLGRLYILPRIGDMHVSELVTEQPLQDIINHAYMHSAQGKKTLSRKTLINIRAVVTGFLKYCRKNGWTSLRPEFLVLPRIAPATNRRTLQPDELRILFASDTTDLGHNRTGPDPLIHMYRFHVLTGLRPGELIGLRWPDINEDYVRIQRSINYYGEITPGKNKNARRGFILPARAAAELEAQRDALMRSGIESDYVFPHPRTGAAMNHKTYRRRFGIYCRHNGIEQTTPYELRHTWYSINKTLPAELVKQMGGHSESMDTFGVYGHELDGERQEFARMLDEVVDRLLAGEEDVE